MANNAPKWLRKEIEKFEVVARVDDTFVVTPRYKRSAMDVGCSVFGILDRMHIADTLERLLNRCLKEQSKP